MSKEILEKKWKEALLGIGLATASPSMAAEPEKPMVFEPSTLHHDLHPIAHLESSFGQNMKHKESTKGELDTAVGALGLKPTTAHEEYLRSPALQKLHPNLKEIKACLNEMKTNPQFYNNVAATHWNRLKKLTGSPEKAAFAWRYGPGAASKTPDADILKDKYVQSYSKMASGEVKKSEDLIKAIDDLKPGKSTKRFQNTSQPGATGFKAFNYDHLLSPQHIANGYSMTAHDNGTNLEVTTHHNGQVVSHVDGIRAASPVLKDRMHLASALVDPKHRGQGLGTAAYEALYAHAKHKAGIKVVIGGAHSSMASSVHAKLAQKHGLGYDAKPRIGVPMGKYPTKRAWNAAPSGEYDEKYDDYRFTLSEEELGKAIGDIKPGAQIAGAENPTFDYSHVLKPEHRAAGYTMHIEHTPTIGMNGPIHGAKASPTVTINHPSAPFGAGILEAGHRGSSINPSVADIPDEHQNKGLGQAMYEALYAHGKHVLGATSISGDEHSTMASRVHQKLSQKHGLGYSPTLNPKQINHPVGGELSQKWAASGAYDKKFAPYSYALKYDDFAKEFEDWNKKS